MNICTEMVLKKVHADLSALCLAWKTADWHSVYLLMVLYQRPDV